MPTVNQKQILNIGKEEIIILYGRMETIESDWATKEKKTETGNQDKLTNTHSHPMKIQKFLSAWMINLMPLHIIVLSYIPNNHLHQHKLNQNLMIAQYQNYVITPEWMQDFLHQKLVKKRKKQRRNQKQKLKKNLRKKKHLKQLFKLNLNQV